MSPFLIFKGKPQGFIALYKFGTYPDVGRYACQEKAWMDESKMNQWIQVILQPWKARRRKNNPSVKPSIFVLDTYCMHQMGSVVNRIQSIGITVMHIPAGCAHLCLPIYVRINTPIKCPLHQKWEDLMMDGDGIFDGVAKESSRKMVAEWIIQVYESIPEKIGQNAWTKQGYEWV